MKFQVKESGVSMSSSKKGKQVDGELVDMISYLPDEILCRILSLMPTKYSFRTSVVSRRWEKLWTLAPKIDFELGLSEVLRRNDIGYTDYIRILDSFSHFVDNSLFLRGNAHIETFRLSHIWELTKIDHQRPTSWIYGSLAFNVRELDLTVADSKIGTLHSLLFTSKTLEVLKLCGPFVIDIPYRVCLPHLKTLFLEDVVYVGDSSIPKLLSGCPELEDLQFINDPWVIVSMYDISHSQLKKLTLHLEGKWDDHAYFDRKVKVDAPNLKFFDFKGRWSGDMPINSNLPSIVEANLETHQFSYSHEDRIKNGKQVLKFLKIVANAECLSLCHHNPNFIFQAIGYELPKFCNLVKLKIHLGSADFSELLMNFLKNSPKLEVLTLPEGISVEDMDFGDGFMHESGDEADDELGDGADDQLGDGADEELGDGANDESDDESGNGSGYEADDEIDDALENSWREPRLVPECLLHSLKSIEILSFGGEKEEEIKVMKYLLENTKTLEKMTISCNYSPPDVMDKLKRELTNHPWGSTRCQLSCRSTIPFE